MARVNQKRNKLKSPSERLLVHRIRLYPNNKQLTYFREASGVKRLAYNWAKTESLRLYKQGVRSSGFDLSKEFNRIKDRDFPFVRRVSKWAAQKAIYDFEDALARFFKGRSGKGPESGFPKYKKKGKARDSFYIGAAKITDQFLHVPKLGRVRMAQRLRFPGEVRSVTISRDADRWFAAVLVKVPDSWGYSHSCNSHAVVGVDLGIKSLAMLSDGTCVENPKWFDRQRRKLRRYNRMLARRVRGSVRWCKQKEQLARLHRRIADQRRNYLHSFTTRLVRSYRYICIEDLNVVGMIRNTRLARSLADASFGEIRRQLEYKTKLAQTHLVYADRWFASTQTCAQCGKKRKTPLRLSDRHWVCSYCGSRHDRDLNAAENLRKVAARYAETINARGAEGSDVGHKPYVKPAVSKRESGSLSTKSWRV